MAYYKRDQLSIKTRTKLADYFADLIVLTESLEAFRVELAQIEFFDGVQLFRYLDHEEKGFLSPKDFGILVSEEVKKVLHYAFGWFDSSKAGEITKIEFLEFLYPRRNPELRQLVSLRMEQELTPEEKQLTIQSQLTLLRQLILELMQRETKLIPIRRYLMDQHDYSIKAVMNCLDVEGRGWISTNDLYKFMRNFDIDVSIESVHGLVGVCDRDYNGKISMEELDWLVEGLERSDSAYRNIVRNTDHKVREKRINSCCTCKRNMTSEKKVLKSHKKEVSKTDKKENRNQWLGKTNEKSSNRQTLREKLNFDSVKHTPKAKETTIKETNEVSAKTTKSKRVHSTILKHANENSHETSYNALKIAFEMAEQETLEIDKELRKYEEEMKLKTELEMQSKLEEVRHKKTAKKEEKEKLRRRIEELEAVRIQEKRIKDEEERMLRMRELETDRLLEIQLEKNRIRELESLRIQAEEQNLWRFEAERNRLREIEIMKEAEFREMELRKEMEIRQMERIRESEITHKEYKLRLAEQELKRNQVDQKIRNKINFENIEREHEYDLFKQTGFRVLDNHFDYEAEARLKELHAEEIRQRSAAKDKETEYYFKYNKYCNSLAQIGDPLGIKEHIAETDKYLRKSKLLREEIKKDRIYSLNRHEGSTLKGSQRGTERQKTLTESSFQRTPVGKMDRESLTSKKNESTKMKWENR